MSGPTIGHIRGREIESGEQVVVAAVPTEQQRAIKRVRYRRGDVVSGSDIVTPVAAVATAIPADNMHCFAATPIYPAAVLQASTTATATTLTSLASSTATLQIESLAEISVGEPNAIMMVPDRITWSSSSVHPCPSLQTSNRNQPSAACLPAAVVSLRSQNSNVESQLCPVCGASVAAVTLSQAASKTDVMHIELRLASDVADAIRTGADKSLPPDWWTLIQLDAVAFTKNSKANKPTQIPWTLQPFGARQSTNFGSHDVKFEVDLRDMVLPRKERMFGTKQWYLCLRFRYGPFALLHLAPFRIHAHLAPTEPANRTGKVSWQLQSQWCATVALVQPVRCMDRLDSLAGDMLGLQVYIEWLNLMADWKGSRQLLDCAREYFETHDDRHMANDALAVLAVLDVQLLYLSNTTAASSLVVGPATNLEQHKNNLLTKVKQSAQHSKDNHVLLLAYYQMWRSLTATTEHSSEANSVNDAFELSHLQSDDSILAGLLYNFAAKALGRSKRKGVSALLKCREWREMYNRAMTHDQRMAQRAASFATDEALQLLLDKLAAIVIPSPTLHSCDSSSTPPALSPSSSPSSTSSPSSYLFRRIPCGRMYDFSWSSGQRPFAESTVILLEYVISVDYERRLWLAATLKNQAVDQSVYIDKVGEGDINALRELYQLACAQFARLQASAMRMMDAWPSLAPGSRVNCIHQVNTARWEFLNYLLDESPARLTRAKEAAALAKSLAARHHLPFYLGEAEKLLREAESQQFAYMVTVTENVGGPSD